MPTRTTVRRVVFLFGLILGLVGFPQSSYAERSFLVQEDFGAVSFLPPIHQPGKTPDRASKAFAVLSVDLPPGYGSMPVELVKQKGNRSIVVERKRTDRKAHATFLVPARKTGGAFQVRIDLPLFPKALQTEPVTSAAWGTPTVHDEFRGKALSSMWQHRLTFYNPHGGRSCSKADPAAVRVGGGAVKLSSMLDPNRSDLCEGKTALKTSDGRTIGTFPYRLNAHLSTQGQASFKYGVAAARIKVQRPKGQHVSFWLLPDGLDYGKPVVGGTEIDVMEWFGESDGNGNMVSTLWQYVDDGSQTHSHEPLGSARRYLSSKSDRWWKAYHVFSVERTPEQYIFRIDGRETWRTTDAASPSSNFLLLSMLSSDYELLKLKDPAVTQSAYVDWVRTWNKKY